MKKFFTLLICSIFVVAAYAQDNPFKMSKKDLRIEQIFSKAEKQQSKKQIAPLPKIPIPDGNVDIVDIIIDIGTSETPYAYLPSLSYVWGRSCFKHNYKYP